VEKYLNAYKKRIFESKGGQVVVREKALSMHSYTPAQLLGMSRDLLNGGTEVNLRTRLDILMGHFMLLRSANRLELQLADVYLWPQHYEGVRGSQNILMCLLRKGKVYTISLKSLLTG
jgi:hypothetical protein